MAANTSNGDVADSSNRLHDRRSSCNSSVPPLSHLLNVNILQPALVHDDEPNTPLDPPPRLDNVEEDNKDDVWAIVEQGGDALTEDDEVDDEEDDEEEEEEDDRCSSGSITDVDEYEDNPRSWSRSHVVETNGMLSALPNYDNDDVAVKDDLWAALGHESISDSEDSDDDRVNDDDADTVTTSSSVPADDLWKSLGIISSSDSSSSDESDGESTSEIPTNILDPLLPEDPVSQTFKGTAPPLHREPNPSLLVSVASEPISLAPDFLHITQFTPRPTDVFEEMSMHSLQNFEGSSRSPSPVQYLAPDSPHTPVMSPPPSMSSMSAASMNSVDSIVESATNKTTVIVPIVSNNVEVRRVRSHSVPEGLDADAMWSLFVQHWRARHEEKSNTDHDDADTDVDPHSNVDGRVPNATPMSITVTSDAQDTDASELASESASMEKQSKTSPPLRPKRPPRPVLSRARSLSLVDSQDALPKKAGQALSATNTGSLQRPKRTPQRPPRPALPNRRGSLSDGEDTTAGYTDARMARTGKHRRTPSVTFLPNPIVTNTYSQDEYRREAWDEQKLSKREWGKIHREMDEFKLLEMNVHPESIGNTFLYKRY